MRDFDAMVIGAGPAGSATALSLARRGFSVAILDKDKFPRPKLCGDFLNPANWPICRELDVAHALLSELHERVSVVRLTAPSGAQAVAPIFSGSGDHAFGLGISRERLDSVLLRAAQRQGATVLEKRRVTELTRQSRRWRVDVATQEGMERLQARILIAADGRNSWVAERAGLTRSSKYRQNAIGLQFLLTGIEEGRNRVEVHLFSGGYAGLVHLGDGTANLCMAVRPDRVRRRNLRDLRTALDLAGNPCLRKLARHARLCVEVRSTSPIYSSPRRSYADGLLLAGDAAQVVEPITGEGIYFALHSGLLAAESAEEALRHGDFSASRLRAYQRRCRRAFRRRRATNRLLRFLVYRLSLGESLIQFSSGHAHLLRTVLHSICSPAPSIPRD